MATSNDSQTKVSINLDDLERKNVKEPFVAVIGGREVKFSDPEDMDWEDLAALESPGDFVDMCTSDEDREHIYDQKLPAFKFKRLFEAYQQHYDLLAARGKRRG